MLNYLRSVIGDMMDQTAQEQSTEIDNDTILEYASIFQELDDLTTDGSLKNTVAAVSVRPPIDIPLDMNEDIELESIELNITDGRVTDIPSDATVQESTDEEFVDNLKQYYAGMKTKKDFIAEAYNHVPRRQRETDGKYQIRVEEYADRQWKEYNERLFQEGVYGHTKLSVNDLAVPDKIHLDFGKGDGNKNYAVTLPIKWEVDRKKRIVKKQIDSVMVWSKIGTAGLERMTDEIFKHVCDRYKIPGNKKKWQVLTPVDVIVPIEPSDQYIIAIGFDTSYSKQPVYYTFSIPLKAINIKKVSEDVLNNVSGDVKPISKFNNVVRKRDVVLEQETYVRRSRFDRDNFYQEAIDFGGGAAPEADAGGGDEPPTDVDAAAPDATPAADTEAPAENSSVANVNDVSDQIAQNVENVTAQQNAEDAANTDNVEDVDINIDNPEADVNADVSDVASPDVDSEIESLDNMGNAEADSEIDMDTVQGNTPDDLDDMTIDELVAHGAEKLKGMTINQLKAFISAPDGTTPEEVETESFRDKETMEGWVNESFFTNASNIKKRIEIEIDDVVPGLYKIYQNCSNGNWDRFGLRKFWGAVRTYEDDAIDIDDDSFGDMDMGSVYKGNQFRSYIDDLDHYLRIATKHKKLKETFTEADISMINGCRNSLSQLHKICDRASSKFRIKHDVKMKEVGEKARFALAHAVRLQRAVKENPQFAEFFTEAYYQEATFITKKNIKQEMEKHIKSSLAIMNDTELSYRALCDKFREEEKALHKILMKASRMKGVFSDTEINYVKALDASLEIAASSIRMNALNDRETDRVKRALIDYVDKCKEVNQYVCKGSIASPNVNQEACAACKAPDAISEEETAPDDQSVEQTAYDSGTMDTNSSDTVPPADTSTDGSAANDNSEVAVGTECGDNDKVSPVTESAKNYTPIRWKNTSKLKDKGLIRGFEHSARFSFPEEFKSVITESNGGTPSKRTFRTNKGERYVKTFLSFNKTDADNIWSEYDWNKDRLNDKFVPFALDSANNPICFNKKDRSVVLVTENAVETISKNFNRFMTSLFIK